MWQHVIPCNNVLTWNDVLILQEAVVSELKRKQRQIKEKKVLNRDEVYHGALEDILLGELLSLLSF